MSNEAEFTFHLFEERELRERFVPAVQGDEEIVRELLDAANASGPSWTALKKMFDETRTGWQTAVETENGETAQRTLFASFARFVSHLRPFYTLTGFSLSLIDRSEFPELTELVRSPGVLLREPSGGAPLPGVQASLAGRIPGKVQPTRSAGGVILKDDVRPFLSALRKDMPRLRDWMQSRNMPAEPSLTILLSAVVEAKLGEYSLIEGLDVLKGDEHLQKDHRRSFDKPAALPPACVREVGRLFGREYEAPKEPEPPPPPPPPETVSYSPQGSYEVGQRLAHKNFGTGEVTRVLDSRRLAVRFDEEEKILVQGLGRPAASEENGAAS